MNMPNKKTRKMAKKREANDDSKVVRKMYDFSVGETTHEFKESLASKGLEWENKMLRILRSAFRNEIFDTKDAYKVLSSAPFGYSKGTVHRALHDFVEADLVVRLGRGIYRIEIKGHKGPRVMREPAFRDSSNRVAHRLSIEHIYPLTKVEKLLRRKGIKFMITGFSLLFRYIHHLPKRLVHLIYVVKGAGELTVTSLREAGLTALLKPTSNEISLTLGIFPEKDIFVVREFSELLGNIDGVARLERALVDLYFETTRRKIPFPVEEVSRIFRKVLRNEPISLSRLFMYAGRRGIREEIKAVIKFIEPDMPIKIKARSNYARRFLDVLEKEEWR